MSSRSLRTQGIAGILITLMFFSGCTPKENASPDRTGNFESTPTQHPITPGVIDEASGIADSRTMNGYLWTHLDSGYPSDLYLVSHDGKTIKKFPVPGTMYIDWEDIAAGPGPQEGVSYLYVGDIGSNTDLNRPVHTINRVPEIKNINESFQAADKISYSYSDGPRDAETLLLDPQTKDLFIISKEESRVHLYKLPHPQSTTSLNTAQFLGVVPGIKTPGLPPTLYTSPTSGDISPDGSEIIVKNYLSVFYWKRKQGESTADALLRAPDKTLPYLVEPEGTAICFDKEGDGYFTLSEIGKASSVTLNYYKRK